MQETNGGFDVLSGVDQGHEISSEPNPQTRPQHKLTTEQELEQKLDATIDPQDPQATLAVLEEVSVLYHGTSSTAAQSIQDNGLDKSFFAAISTEDAIRFQELYKIATGDDFPIADHARNTVFVTPSRGLAEFYAGSLGEMADMIQDRAPTVLTSGRLGLEERVFVEELVAKIDAYRKEAEPVVVALSGMALHYIADTDRETGGMTAEQFVKRELDIWAKGLADREAPTLGGFLEHLVESINELELSTVPSSAVLFIRNCGDKHTTKTRQDL